MKKLEPSIRPRKKPRQTRSKELVADVLEAAIRVLLRDGGARFTTVRVAEEAGVSVGSLYQYFPNREALLFRLQADEWVDTWSLMEEILGDMRLAPRERLERAVLTFFRSEREEAPLRRALDEAGAPFRDAPEAEAIVARAVQSVRAFAAEAMPNASERERTSAAELVMTSLAALAERVTEGETTRREVDAWAKRSTEMYWSYLAGVGRE